jgi:MinD superfamily P-loop ATPase
MNVNIMNAAWLPKIDPCLCNGCGDCIQLCPAQALTLIGRQAVVAFPELCSYCGMCEDFCPLHAIEAPFLICFDESGVESG